MDFRIETTETCDAWLEERQKKDRASWVRVLRRIGRLRLGNFGDAKPVGDGVSELRLDFGPGFRVYFMRRGEQVVVLLCGGDKSTQAADIAKAKGIAKSL